MVSVTPGRCTLTATARRPAARRGTPGRCWRRRSARGRSSRRAPRRCRPAPTRCATHLVPRHRRHVVLQLGELFGQVRRDEVAARGEDLAHLDEGRTEALESMADAHGAREVLLLDRGVVLHGHRRLRGVLLQAAALQRLRTRSSQRTLAISRYRARRRAPRLPAGCVSWVVIRPPFAAQAAAGVSAPGIPRGRPPSLPRPAGRGLAAAADPCTAGVQRFLREFPVQRRIILHGGVPRPRRGGSHDRSG